MSDTLERPTAPSDRSATPARQAAERWLGEFEAALAARDAERAARLFAAASFWRDLVAFTWNIKTVENPEGVRDLLEAQLDHISASRFELEEEPQAEDGVVTA